MEKIIRETCNKFINTQRNRENTRENDIKIDYLRTAVFNGELKELFAKEFINSTRGQYNELVYERRDLENGKFYKKNPDFIVFYEEFDNLDNIEQCFQKYLKTHDTSLLSGIITNFENNRTGTRGHSYLTEKYFQVKHYNIC